jgi:hopanoid biosynthesis associated radical SAM protein HpnH
MRIGAYLLKQKLLGRKRYPLVLMLEPLFRCNLACAGCGKIDYPDAILNKRISVEDALASVDECGAPVVVIAGGEPLIHKDLPKIVEGLIAQGRFVIVCTNALLLEKKIHEYEPSPYFTWSIHLDGDREMHDRSVCRQGVYDKAVAALKLAKARGFRVTINCTIFNNAEPGYPLATSFSRCLSDAARATSVSSDNSTGSRNRTLSSIPSSVETSTGAMRRSASMTSSTSTSGAEAPAVSPTILTPCSQAGST